MNVRFLINFYVVALLVQVFAFGLILNDEGGLSWQVVIQGIVLALTWLFANAHMRAIDNYRAQESQAELDNND